MSTPRFRKRLRLGSATWWQCRTRSERNAGQYSANVLGEEPGEARGQSCYAHGGGASEAPASLKLRAYFFPS